MAAREADDANPARNDNPFTTLSVLEAKSHFLSRYLSQEPLTLGKDLNGMNSSAFLKHCSSSRCEWRLPRVTDARHIESLNSISEKTDFFDILASTARTYNDTLGVDRRKGSIPGSCDNILLRNPNYKHHLGSDDNPTSILESGFHDGTIGDFYANSHHSDDVEYKMLRNIASTGEDRETLAWWFSEFGLENNTSRLLLHASEMGRPTSLLANAWPVAGGGAFYDVDRQMKDVMALRTRDIHYRDRHQKVMQTRPKSGGVTVADFPHLFADINSRHASGDRGLHRALLTSSEVKQYRPTLNTGNLSWSEDFDVKATCEHLESEENLFRPVPTAIRDLVRKHLHLFRSPLHQCEENKNSNESADDNLKDEFLEGIYNWDVYEIESTVGRHIEGIADAVLQMIFDYFEPFELPRPRLNALITSLLPSRQGQNVETEKNDMDDSYVEDIRDNGIDVDVDDDEDQVMNCDEVPYDKDIKDGTIINNGPAFLHQPQSRKNLAKAVPRLQTTVKAKMMKRRRREVVDAMAKSSLLNWEHILGLLQTHVQELKREDKCFLHVHDKLPDLRLSPQVMHRIKSRLLGLFDGALYSPLARCPPKVVRTGMVDPVNSRTHHYGWKGYQRRVPMTKLRKIMQKNKRKEALMRKQKRRRKKE